MEHFDLRMTNIQTGLKIRREYIHSARMFLFQHQRPEEEQINQGSVSCIQEH